MRPRNVAGIINYRGRTRTSFFLLVYNCDWSLQLAHLVTTNTLFIDGVCEIFGR